MNGPGKEAGGERGALSRAVGELSAELSPVEAPAKQTGAGFALSWETLLGIVGAAAALGLWINVVGAAVLWARFEAADLPPSQVVGIVPNSTLLAAGVRALVLPLVVGVVAVAIFHVARSSRSGDDWSGSQRPAGFDRVLLVLAVLAALAVFLIFGGSATVGAHPEYVFAWALASPFLVVGAATYEPASRSWLAGQPASRQASEPASGSWLTRPHDWRRMVGLVVFLGACGIGLVADQLLPAACVAVLALVAAELATRMDPEDRRLGLSAGMLLIVFYLVLGAGMFLLAGGRPHWHPARQRVPLVLAVLAGTLGLLFLHAAAKRARSFGALAALAFAVVAAWGGLVGYLKERNARPSFDLTAMLRKPEAIAGGRQLPRPPVSGYLIARTGDAVLVAVPSRSFTTRAWRIVLISRDQVEEMSVGPGCVVDEKNMPIAATLAAELESEHDSADRPSSGFGSRTQDRRNCAG